MKSKFDRQIVIALAILVQYLVIVMFGTAKLVAIIYFPAIVLSIVLSGGMPTALTMWIAIITSAFIYAVLTLLAIEYIAKKLEKPVDK